jgi:hypothetical protein
MLPLPQRAVARRRLLEPSDYTANPEQSGLAQHRQRWLTRPVQPHRLMPPQTICVRRKSSLALALVNEIARSIQLTGRRVGTEMDQHHPELVVGRSGTGSSAIQHFTRTRSDPVALPESNPISARPVFGSSHSHRVWRMMNALIDAKPEWADQDTFEADRRMMLQYGLSTGMPLEELLRITDPDVILGLWTAAEAKGAED